MAKIFESLRVVVEVLLIQFMSMMTYFFTTESVCLKPHPSPLRPPHQAPGSRRLLLTPITPTRARIGIVCTLHRRLVQ